MTRNEVWRIMGCSPADYRPAIWRNPGWYVSTSDIGSFLEKESGRSLEEVEALRQKGLDEWFRKLESGNRNVSPRRMVEIEDWTGRSYSIRVAYDEEGRVIHSSLWSVPRPRAPADFRLKLQWWLGW